MMKLSTQNRPGANDVDLVATQAGLALACCNDQVADEVAFGDGLELALAFAADGVTPIAPEWVQLFPAGPDINARDGRKWTLPDPTVLIAAFQANRAQLAFDINHVTEIEGPKGGEAPAQGWIQALQVRGDGTTWARVDWNEAGKLAIASKQYKYVSPAFLFTKAGEIRALTSAALVTHPALDMPALARRGAGSPTNQQDNEDMKTLAQRLLEALGLPADANEDAIVAAATTQVGLARDARDSSKLVPAGDLQAALARATTAETALQTRVDADNEAAAVSLVDQAVADGKIAPASKDHWLGLARANRAGVEATLGSMSKVMDPPKIPSDPELEDKDANGLTADQKALCRDMGISEVAFAATLNMKESA